MGYSSGVEVTNAQSSDGKTRADGTPPARVRVPAPVVILGLALGLFLLGGVSATALGLVSKESPNTCAHAKAGQGSDLAGADLTGSMLAGAELCGSNLRGAILVGACLRGARLQGADLTGALLDSADMTGAETSGTLGLPSPLPRSSTACD